MQKAPKPYTYTITGLSSNSCKARGLHLNLKVWK